MVSDFAMDQERHADLLHPFEHAHDLRDIGDAMRAAGGGMRGIEFRGGEYAFAVAARHFVGIAIVGQIGDDQRREIELGRHGGVDPIAIGNAFLGGRNRRRQVRHHDRSRKLARGILRDMI
jgi:hypothetical protein